MTLKPNNADGSTCSMTWPSNGSKKAVALTFNINDLTDHLQAKKAGIQLSLRGEGEKRREEWQRLRTERVEVHEDAWRYMEVQGGALRYMEVHEGAQRGAWRCMLLAEYDIVQCQRTRSVQITVSHYKYKYKHKTKYKHKYKYKYKGVKTLTTNDWLASHWLAASVRSSCSILSHAAWVPPNCSLVVEVLVVLVVLELLYPQPCCCMGPTHDDSSAA